MSAAVQNRASLATPGLVRSPRLRMARRLYQAASALFVLFAALHTFGFLSFRAPTAEARALYESMFSVHFRVGGATFSYGGFYVGFGLYVSLYLLFSALLAWKLSSLSVAQPEAIGLLGWALFTLQLISFGLSWIYFSTGPAAFSAITAGSVGFASWLVTSLRRESVPMAAVGQAPPKLAAGKNFLQFSEANSRKTR